MRLHGQGLTARQQRAGPRVQVCFQTPHAQPGSPSLPELVSPCPVTHEEAGARRCERVCSRSLGLSDQGGPHAPLIPSPELCVVPCTPHLCLGIREPHPLRPALSAGQGGLPSRIPHPSSRPRPAPPLHFPSGNCFHLVCPPAPLPAEKAARLPPTGLQGLIRPPGQHVGPGGALWGPSTHWPGGSWGPAFPGPCQVRAPLLPAAQGPRGSWEVAQVREASLEGSAGEKWGTRLVLGTLCFGATGGK